MALSVVKYPFGYKANTSTTYTAIVSDTSPDGAFFSSPNHGLSNGDFIYIFSQFEQYNGWWEVVLSGDPTNSFRLVESPPTDLVTVRFVNSGTVYFWKNDISIGALTTNRWNSVHQPVIYVLKSTSWPINGVDTARTITTFTNYNGYTYLVATGDIKATGVAASLESVVLSGTSVDGVYKIIQWFSDTNFVIDLAYSAGNVLSSGTVQYYYMNYHAKVKVYAGLDGSHYWTAQKPYELVAEIRAIPDSTGLIIVNVNEYVKKQIEIFKNNLQQDTLPNDVDSWCRIYISYAESYDDSNGYTVSEVTSSYTDDTTTIYLGNVVPPFKSRDAGSLSPWISGDTANTRFKWLTPFLRPTIFSGYYFDLAYIETGSTNNNYMKIDRYADNRVLISSTIENTANYEQGIYRFSLSVTGSEKTIDVTYYNSSNVQRSETITIDVDDASSCHDTTPIYLTWKNYLGGQDYWLFKAQKTYGIEGEESEVQDINIFSDWPDSYGEFASTIRGQTSRISRAKITVNSQFLTKAQTDAISLIKASGLVQQIQMSPISGTYVPILTTVLLDDSPIRKYQDRDKTYNLSFEIQYTNILPVQTL